jgi:diacylglycerol kinase
MNSFFKSFGYAFKGIKVALSQRNLKIHVCSAAIVILLGFFFQITTIEWCIISLCIALVIALEMINTAIEYLVDLVSPQFNDKAGKIKDITAGAVLVVSISALLCGILIFRKYIVALL